MDEPQGFHPRRGGFTSLPIDSLWSAASKRYVRYCPLMPVGTSFLGKVSCCADLCVMATEVPVPCCLPLRERKEEPDE